MTMFVYKKFARKVEIGENPRLIFAQYLEIGAS